MRITVSCDGVTEGVRALSSEENSLNAQRIVSLADEEAVRQVLATTMTGLWQAVNTLSRLRLSRRERYRVAIFGSARAQPGSFAYEEVKRAPNDIRIPQCLDTADEAIDVVRALHEAWKRPGAPASGR